MDCGSFARLLAACFFAFLPMICVRALDVTQNDDYWNTSGYVNPEPDASSAIALVDVFVSNENPSNAMDTFTSIPKSGFYIMVR